jgi:hypothetical protein
VANCPSFILTFVSLMNKVRWGTVQWIVLPDPLEEEDNCTPARLLFAVVVRMSLDQCMHSEFAKAVI